ncbi:hypothetical protein EJ05DRAFT_502368 [Pseudovirgaria hyperparasitica]|uniref:P-loop containing nucleoside triphosphate hydrolase protein n=1 Tax=Pseudovirgaria hyperparasitica TaxID=470096 RepID=A0A6A6W060_9PEZI|nr:uncharacterized protein EJ05DRAFT_502368 [Pseudovirgaria hyperparasitica]KAF2755895.1 hypothetical protein EJ05DRAFT_502368 [Pseudovirgaria hyperparasitica]
MPQGSQDSPLLALRSTGRDEFPSATATSQASQYANTSRQSQNSASHCEHDLYERPGELPEDPIIITSNPPKSNYSPNAAPSATNNYFPIDSVHFPGLRTGDVVIPLTFLNNFAFNNDPPEARHAKFVKHVLQHLFTSQDREEFKLGGTVFEIVHLHTEKLVVAGDPFHVLLYEENGMLRIMDLHDLNAQREEELSHDQGEAALIKRALIAHRQDRLSHPVPIDPKGKKRSNEDLDMPSLRRIAKYAERMEEQEATELVPSTAHSTDQQDNHKAVSEPAHSFLQVRFRKCSQAARVLRLVYSRLKKADLIPTLLKVSATSRRLKRGEISDVITCVIESHRAAWEVIDKPYARAEQEYRYRQGEAVPDGDRGHGLLTEAFSRVAHLKTRLYLYITAIEGQSWSGTFQIQKQCETIGSTVKSLELAQWWLGELTCQEELANSRKEKAHNVSRKLRKTYHIGSTDDSQATEAITEDLIGILYHDRKSSEDSIQFSSNEQVPSGNPFTNLPRNCHLDTPPAAMNDNLGERPVSSSVSDEVAAKANRSSSNHTIATTEPGNSGSKPYWDSSAAEIEAWDVGKLPSFRNFRFLTKLVHTIPKHVVKDLQLLFRNTGDSKRVRADSCARLIVLLMHGQRPCDPSEEATRTVIHIRMAYETGDTGLLFNPDTQPDYDGFLRGIGRSNTLRVWRVFLDIFVNVLHAWKEPTAAYANLHSSENPMPTMDPPSRRSLNSYFRVVGTLTDDMAKNQSIALERFQSHMRDREPDSEDIEELLEKRPEYRDYEHDLVVLNPMANVDEYVVMSQDKKTSRDPPLKRHQVEGLRFLWREIVEAKEQEGCLLAHTMGLGKSRQIIEFLQVLQESANSSNTNIAQLVPPHLSEVRALLLCPASVVENWFHEHNKWGIELEVVGGHIIHTIKAMGGTSLTQLRLDKIRYWNTHGGLLILSYDMFVGYTKPAAESDTVWKPTAPRAKPESQMTQKQRDNKAARESRAKNKAVKEEIQLEEIKTLLLDAPNLVIADESQRLKNMDSVIAQCASRFRTKSRIALTGTPLSNNLGEYYSSINWIAPGYLGDAQDFKRLYQRPIEQGLYKDSGKALFKRSREVLTVLRETIRPKIHRREITSLEEHIPGKVEFIITLPLTPIQRKTYTDFVRGLHCDETENNFRIFGWLSALAYLNTHPQFFLERLKERKRIQREAAIPAMTTRDSHGRLPDVNLESDTPLALSSLSIPPRLMDTLEKDLSAVADLESSVNSWKLEMLLEILRYCSTIKDKVLVFSQYKTTLRFLQRHIENINLPCFVLDGDVSHEKRLEDIHEFNTSVDWSVYLVSTLAGGTGLNMYAANRVITFDHHFNPAMEEQAIGRAYRLGQTKKTFVYHLALGNTFETALHITQVYKQQLAARAVDGQAPLPQANHVKEYLFVPVEDGDPGSIVCAGADESVLGPISAVKKIPILGVLTTDEYRRLNPEEAVDDGPESVAVEMGKWGGSEMVLALRRRAGEGMEEEGREETGAPAVLDSESMEEDLDI